MVKGLKGFSTVKAGGSTEKKTIPNGVEIIKWKDFDKKRLKVRLVGPVIPYVIHWVDIKTKNKETTIPKVCCNYNPNEDEWNDNGCPWCDISASSQRRYMVNAIIRELQDQEPKKVSRTKSESKMREVADGYEACVKDPNSTSWTPIRALVFSGSVAKQLKDLTEQNRDKKDRVRELSDPKYGMDVTIKYDSDETGTGMFRVDSVKRTPLTEEELKYLIQDIFKAIEIPSLKEAKEEFDELDSKGLLISSESDDDEDDEDAEDLDDENEEDDEEDFDSDTDDDEDEDDDYEDDDEDDEPVKKKKKKNKDKKSKKDKKKKKKKSLSLDDL